MAIDIDGVPISEDDFVDAKSAPEGTAQAKPIAIVTGETDDDFLQEGVSIGSPPAFSPLRFHSHSSDLLLK